MFHRSLIQALFGALLAIVGVSGCTDDSSHCDATSLQEALDAAGVGQIVRIGKCTVTGTFIVPEGVTLAGAGLDSSTIVADTEDPALRLVPGDVITSIRDLTVMSDERVAVLTMGSGRSSIERVHLEVTRGIALGAEALTELQLDEVEISGPITEANAASLVPSAMYEDTAVVGVLLVDVEDASLTEVRVNGFALYGLVSVSSGLTWNGGGATQNRGYGLFVHGGRAGLHGLALGETYHGGLAWAVAGAFASGADIETTELVVSESEGIGFLHDNVTVRHTDLRANDNQDVGLWVQRCPFFELSGSLSALTRNRFSGIALFETEETILSGAHIEETVAGVMIDGELGSMTVGDGVHAIDPGSSLTFRGIQLTRNERVGALLDLSDSDAEVILDGVTVDGVESQYGVVAQGFEPSLGWDDGVERSGATIENDEGFDSALPTMSQRLTDDPNMMIIADEGVAGIIGDCGSY